MDRGKNLPSKAAKGKPIGFPGDFIALGSKPSRPADTNDARKTQSSASGSSSVAGSSKMPNMPVLSSGVDRKRDREVPTVVPPHLAMKKAKATTMLPTPGPLTTLGRGPTKTEPVAGTPLQPDPWEEVAVEVEVSELLQTLLEAEAASDEEKIEAVLCGAIKQLRTACVSQRVKADPSLVLSLMYLAKWRPSFFFTELVVDALASLLKRENLSAASGFKAKTGGLATGAVLAANVLLAAFQDETSWPEVFVKVYIEDAIGDRVWVDREECQSFVENVLTAFNTKIPPRHVLQQESSGNAAASAASSPSVSSVASLSINVNDEEGSVDSDVSQTGLLLRSTAMESTNIQVQPRYESPNDVEGVVLDVVREQLNRRQQPTSDLTTRNLLKFMAATSGIAEVRLLASQRLELWLTNPKLSRPATELLLAVCINCTLAPTDTDVINHLLRLRLKTKPLLNVYVTCFKEQIEQRPDQLPGLLRLVIFNELSPSRGSNNMAVLGVMFQHWPDLSARCLADIFLELLLNKDDYLRALRALLREIVRALRHELPLTVFCASLLQATGDKRENSIREFEFKDRLLVSLADMVSLCVFLIGSSSVRESAMLAARGDLKEIEYVRQYQIQAAAIQREAVFWLYKTVPTVFRPSKNDYVHCLHKVLFMESAEHYYNKDGWPPENERTGYLRLALEIPVLEDTLIHLLLIGLSKEHQLSAPDALELCEQLMRRVAPYNYAVPVLSATNLGIIDMMISLSVYHYPENIVLPAGYVPPKLAITALYWKAWLMLLLLTAHNPSTFGSTGWNNYPTLRTLMEMCITNSFSSFPPVPSPGGSATEQQELQISGLEKQLILEFESHLAAASTKMTITESSSLLISQLTSLDPRGPARRPPPAVLEQLRSLNATLKLGHLLCRSRQPDFLLDILNRQGPAQSMPWLAELVESNEGAWGMLPVQCLCEFLLHEAAEETVSSSSSNLELLDDGGKSTKRKDKRGKQAQLVQHLKFLLKDPSQVEEACREVIDYLVRRLSSQQTSARQQAIMGLSLVLSSKDEDGAGVSADSLSAGGSHEDKKFTWLLQQLPVLPHFAAVRPVVVTALRAALQVETQPRAVAAYISFLAHFTREDGPQELADMATDLSQMIVERSSLLSALLTSPPAEANEAKTTLESLLALFWEYFQKARVPNKEVYTWSDNQEQVLVQWQSGEAATLNILVIHATVILLTYGMPLTEAGNIYFNNLMQLWFPSTGEPPQAFLVETSEEAFLFPDWLKLKMIRSSVDVLVDAALRDLEPGQLILFIQSFGIPVASMSKLLHCLDRMVQAHPFAFVEVDMDKSYMQQLLQVQWQRGAQGGLQFADIMQLNEPEPAREEQGNPRVLGRPDLPANPQDRSTALLHPNQATSVLRQLFNESSVIRFSQTEKREAYRLLTKSLAAEVSRKSSAKTSAEVVAAALDGLLNLYTAESEALLQGMEKQLAFSCGLLRLLTSAAAGAAPQSLLVPVVLRICHRIASSVVANPKSPLRSIAQSFLEKTTPPAAVSPAVFPQRRDSDFKREELEQRLKKLNFKNLTLEDSKPLIDSLVTNLTINKPGSKSTGLFVDWLELLDPEIVAANPDLERSLLFSKAAEAPACRPYLLALLIHQARWKTLAQCVEQVLSSKCNSSYDPMAVLDFLTACTRIPKLWQGRDKHVPKHHQHEDLLCLNQDQLVSLAHFIVEEKIQHLSTNGSEDLLQNRVNLLLGCCGGSLREEMTVARAVAKLLESSNSRRKEAAQQLLLHIYIRAPHIISKLESKISPVFSNAAEVSRAVSCATDSLFLTLLSSMATPQPGKDGARKLADFEVAARKMASANPLLVLRLLPSLAAILRGRAHLDLYVLRSRNYLNLYSCFLGIVQLMAPAVYAPEYRSSFLDLLTSYMNLFEYHRSEKEMAPLLQQLMQTMTKFMAVDGVNASTFLKQHVELLHELQMNYPDITPIKDLLLALNLPRQATDSVAVEQPSTRTRGALRISPMLSRLRQSDNAEDIIQVLQDIENVCHRESAAPLEQALGDLQPLLSATNQAVRNLAYSLILRYLNDNPQAAASVVQDYLDCLDSNNAAVVTSALQRLPDFVLLAQDHGKSLLQKAFALAVEGGYNSLDHLKDAMMLLQQQSGT